MALIIVHKIIASINIEPMLFLYYFSNGLLYPTTVALWYNKVCMILYKDDWICDNINTNETLEEYEKQVQIVNSQWDFYSNICGTIPSIFLTFVYGSWSDRYSRKLPIVLPILGNIISNIVYIFSAEFMQSSGGYMLLASFIKGISGGTTSMFMATVSYVSDAAGVHSRTFRISIVYGIMYMAGFISNTVSGVMFEATGFTFIFSACIVLNLIGLLYLLFGFPDINHSQKLKHGGSSNKQEEPNSKEKTSPSAAAENQSSKQGNVCCNYSDVKETIFVIWRKRKNNDRAHIIAILVAFALHSIGSGSEFTVSYLFLKHPPLSFTQAEYGYYSGYKQLIQCTCVLIVIPIIKKHFSVPDSLLYVLAFVSNIAQLLMLGLSVTKWMVFLSPILGYVNAGLYVFGRTMLTMMVDVTEIGKVFSILAFIQNIMHIVTSALYNYFLYPATIDFFPGFSFVFGAIILLIPTSIAIWVHVDIRRQKSYSKAISDINDYYLADDSSSTFDRSRSTDLHEYSSNITVQLPDGNHRY